MDISSGMSVGLYSSDAACQAWVLQAPAEDARGPARRRRCAEPAWRARAESAAVT